MKKFFLPLIVISLIFTVILVTQSKNEDTVPEQTNNQQSAEVTIAKPSTEDVINLFFELINEKKIVEALNMMKGDLISGDSIKQQWGVNFNSLDFVEVTNVKPSNESEWTESKKVYEVTLDIEVSESGADAPIPYYGWTNGQNLRWITIEKENEEWKISEIATGR